MRLARLILALAGLLALGAAAPAHDGRCERLGSISLPGIEIESSETVAGAFTAPDGTRLDVAPSCRVRGVVRPSPASRIGFELWLPQRWNGRYYQLGNGGFAGNIHVPSLAAEAARGNAAAVTDTGHSGTGQFDASWAAGHPERIRDYGHRSIKATSDAAAKLIRLYYGRPAAHRYYAGCSNGGRQALMAAQRYPGDWDGIIAGAPANRFSHQLNDFADIQYGLRFPSINFIPLAKLPAIQSAALASCPAGTVEHGVALDPRSCRFDPASLYCFEGGADCLDGAQLATLKRLIADGFQPTSAAVPDSWSQWILNPDPAAPSQLVFAVQAFRYVLQDRPDWRLEEHPPGTAIRSSWRTRAIDADSTDYRAFRDRGGRIISYFGWADALISPGEGVDYYRQVQRAMDGPAATALFYRLFMVPGMTHCQGGPGPDSFGQSIPAPAAAPDRRHDIRLALEAWVERGEAPDELVAVSYNSGDPAKGVETERVLHPLD
jgi:feruloyl esterase